MGFASDIINNVCGEFLADFGRWLALQTKNTAAARTLEKKFNPDQLHEVTRGLIAESLAEVLQEIPDATLAEWKTVLEHPENRLRLVGWALESRADVDLNLGEWSLENAPHVDMLRPLLAQLHKTIQEKKKKYFGPEYFNLTGQLCDLLVCVASSKDASEKRLDEVIGLLNQLLRESTLGKTETERLSEDERISRLNSCLCESKARCVERWQAAGVPRQMALDLVEETSLGAASGELNPSDQNPVKLLVADLGVGKSLIGERMHQAAVALALADRGAPIPVWLRAGEAAGRLIQVVLKGAQGFGNVTRQGATIVVDGADETGLGAAIGLLREARILVGTWPHTTIVITSRPIPTLVSEEEAVSVPVLTEDQAMALIARRGKREFNFGMMYGWPQSVRDAVRRPLFALIMGGYLENHDYRVPRSSADLIANLVERAIGRTKVDQIAANQLLQKLARLSTDRGGAIPATEIAARAEVSSLLQSGLVVESVGMLSFPLPLLTQWFAAQSLSSGSPDCASLVDEPRRLENWRYPLIIAAGAFNHDIVTKLLRPLAERHPAFASEVIKEGLANWGLAEDVLPPSAQECGQRIRTAMASFVKGIGPLAKLVAPLRPDGTLKPVGVRVEKAMLIASWYEGEPAVADVVELPPLSADSPDLRHNWPGIHAARPGRQPGWAWRWALEGFTSPLSVLIRDQALPIDEGPLLAESIWELVLNIMGYGSLFHGPVSLDLLDQRLNAIHYNVLFYGSSGKLFGPQRLDELRTQVASLKNSGAQFIQPPWPGAGQPPTAPWIWSHYSPEAMLNRAVAVYGAALVGYRQLLNRWFPALSSRMELAVMQPVRVIGKLNPNQPVASGETWPILTWYFEPLPIGSRDVVDFRLHDHPLLQMHGAVYKKLPVLRPDAAEWLGFAYHDGLLDIFDAKPVTKIVYEWLSHDLKRIAWI